MTYEIINKAHLAAARSIDQLRRQLSIVLEDDSGKAAGAVPIEGLTATMFSTIHALPNVKISLLITGARARHLGLSVDGQCVRLDAQNLSLQQLWAIADPLSENTKPDLPPLVSATPACNMLLSMTKYAALLPAILAIESTAYPSDWLRINMQDVKAYWTEPSLEIVPLVTTKFPVIQTDNATLTCFRGRYGTSTHLALVIGDITNDKNPLTRVHSSCITGDILGSLRCDCGNQLAMALDQIAAEGKGILLYLHQEGRGIGIANKLRAYKLQEQGFDTYEANRMLGFDEDERDFSIGAAILKKIGVKSIRMLTNNPHKMGNMEKNGIKVAERVGLVTTISQHSHDYIAAKTKAGHKF